MNPGTRPSYFGFAARVIVIHTATYFLFGMLMSNLFDYSALFQREIIRDFMRPLAPPYSFIGPLLQPLRGLLISLALWPIRKPIIESNRGWLLLWSIFVVFGILATPAAAPSSVEGLIYSRLPLWYHLIGLPEILLQTLTFSIVLVSWEKARARPRTGGDKLSTGRDLLTALIISSFAWVGYAVGALLSAVIAAAEIDFAAGSDLRVQAMFLVAFVINLILIPIVSRQWGSNRIVLWQVFLLFWAIEALVPYSYQLLLGTPMPIHLLLIMALFPALAITAGIRLGYARLRQEL